MIKGAFQTGSRLGSPIEIEMQNLIGPACCPMQARFDWRCRVKCTRSWNTMVYSHKWVWKAMNQNQKD